MWRMRDLVAYLGVSYQRINQLTYAGRFPEPVSEHPRTWKAVEVERWAETGVVGSLLLAMPPTVRTARKRGPCQALCAEGLERPSSDQPARNTYSDSHA